MATLTKEPSAVTAGDTISWIRSVTDYPASDGWALSYRLIGAAGKYDITAIASGSDFLISVAAAVSVGWAAGDYTWQAMVTKAGERYTVGTGKVSIRPNLAGMATTFDARSQAQQAVDQLLALRKTWATTSAHIQEYEIAGRKTKFRSIADIDAELSFWRRELANEQAAEHLAQGGRTGRRLLVRF